MKQNHLLLLLGTLILLLGVAYLAGVFEGDASTVDVPEVDLPGDALEQIRIEAPAQTLALQRQGTRWLLTEPLQAPADSLTAARFVESLGDLDLAAVASNNPDRYARYGVDSTATVITASWPDGTHRLTVGNQGPDYQSVYIRLDDDPRVYTSSGRINIPDGLDRWRDKTVATIRPGQVTAVSVEQPEASWEIRRGPAGWQLSEQGASVPADSAAVARWLQRFAPMTADGFMDDLPAPVVRETSKYRLVFSTAAGVTETIHLLQRDDGYAVTSDTGTTTYRLVAARLATYVPEPETLK